MRGYEDQKLEDSRLLSSLKANREHYNRNIDDLLGQFSEEGSYADTFKLFGSKYNERIKQFQQLKADNTKLRLQTRELQQQLSLFRNSMQDSGWKEEDIINRISIQRAKPESTFNFISSEPSAREVFKSKQQQIEKMKEEAKQDYEQQFQDYDRLLKEMFKFLEMTANTKELLKQMRPASQGSSSDENSTEMVMVPRKKYEMLVQLYSVSYAEHNVKKYLQNLAEGKPEHEETLEKIQEQFVAKKDQYSNIVKAHDFQLSGLQTFFHKLAEKFGFEKEWERYHVENKSEAVALKSQIDEILKPGVIQSPEKIAQAVDKEPEEQDKKPSVEEKLRRKLNSLVKVIPFSQKQKQCWSQLSTKIHNEQLFSAEKVEQILKKVHQESKMNQLAQFASIVHTTVSTCVSKLEALLLSKYKKGIFQRQELEAYYKEDHLLTTLEGKLAENPDDEPLIMAKQLSESVLQNVFKRLNKQIVFASTRSIQAILRRYS